ncbi:4-hydroxyproline epimerase [soil metagenome]
MSGGADEREARVRIIDSHTAGEPTRVVVAGGPELRGETAAAKREEFAARHDRFRRALINEPRGSEVLVGALLTETAMPGCSAGVVFFNNAGVLRMCGHGLIGLVVTLGYLGRAGAGTHRIDTPAGVVTATYDGERGVSFENVPCHRLASGVVADGVAGDVAWGGNWFFITGAHGLEISRANVAALTARAMELRAAVNRKFPDVDHIELTDGNRNFVLCPGAEYDRSPCGTGTCAKMACLFEDGQLREGETWRQEGILGTVFEGSVERVGDALVPTVRGEAHVTGVGDLVFGPDDPFRWGIS